ncbi:pentapeptide repeat-containing protein, partial [Corynebacterium marambiense]|uniref:pentapeptide repeat-containing protein n=1 Tax=Corynebacterium marambiense TaxID=2765364 RepID=UPI0036103647
MGENNRTNVGTDGEATETTEFRENFWTVDGIPDSYPRIVRGAIWMVAMLFRLVALPLRLLLWGLERPCVTDADVQSEQSAKSVSTGHGDGSDGESPRYISRWRTIRDRQQIATIGVFLVLPVALIGEGWGALWKGLGSGPAWQWILVGLAVAVVLVWLSVWLTELVPEPGKRWKHGDGGSGAEVPNKAPYAERLFVLLAVLALAAGVRVILVSDLERTVQLAAGLFAAGGVALSVWATQRRSLDQQEREDKRQHDRLVRESVLQDDRLRREAELQNERLERQAELQNVRLERDAKLQNERLEFDSFRGSRQLSVQQRLDLSQKLAVSIGHLAHDDVTVRAAAVAELIFQIDDWSSLERSERAVIEVSADQQKEHKIKELENESLRRRQELFDLAFKSDIRGQSVSEVRTRGAGPRLVDGDRGCFAGVDLSGMVAPGAQAPEASLKGMKLRGAHLERANLQRAHLEGANLGLARLDGADLRKARLEGAHLGEARLEGVDLRDAHLEEADLRGVKLEGAKLRDAHLERAYLGEARLEGANLGEARLEGAYLGGARLEGADLGGARLEGADLRGARLEGAYLRGAGLEGVSLG